MSTGGIFTIITNDGKQDRILTATALLKDRLEAISRTNTRQKGGNPGDLDNLPTLTDIEKTHVLFTNAHFKPFAAIGFEYNKVRATSGNPSLGQPIQFSIPQFGDFFHDIACHAVLTQPTLNVDAGTDPSDEPTMRWCHFPGERLLKKVCMEVNGNPLDEYTSYNTNMHREFRVQPNKRLGWDRCVGQQENEKGWVRQPDWAGNNVSASDVTHRVDAEVQTGLQTPTGQKSGDLELFMPLLFWFNKDVRLAIPSVAIPYGQRFINIELASLEEMVGLVPRGTGTYDNPNGSLTEPTPTLKSIELYINNIFVNPEVHKIYIKRVGFSLIRVHRQQLYNAQSSESEVHLQQLKWPVETLFVGMKLREFAGSSNTADLRKNLAKWHLFSNETTETYKSTGQKVLRESALFVAGSGDVGRDAITVELDTAAVRSLTGTALLALDVQLGDTLVIAGQSHTAADDYAAGTAAAAVEVYGGDSAVVADSAVLADAAVLLSLQGLEYQAKKCSRTLNNISIRAHGINIYDNFPSGFFNAYIPYHYGGHNINTPEDCGACLITFCLFPGSYQPSGYINVSRAREFYINYTSSVIGTESEGRVPGTLVVIATAINFLLISDGSAVLRYST